REKPRTARMNLKPFSQHLPEQRRNCHPPGCSLFPRPLLFMEQNRVPGKIHIGNLRPQEFTSPGPRMSRRTDEWVYPGLCPVFLDVSEQLRDLAGPKVQAIPKVGDLLLRQAAGGDPSLDLSPGLEGRLFVQFRELEPLIRETPV